MFGCRDWAPPTCRRAQVNLAPTSHRASRFRQTGRRNRQLLAEPSGNASRSLRIRPALSEKTTFSDRPVGQRFKRITPFLPPELSVYPLMTTRCQYCSYSLIIYSSLAEALRAV